MDLNYKRPESVLVVVYASDETVLLLERIDVPGFWQSVTGSLRWKETPYEAAVRELKEETGLLPAVSNLVDRHQQNRFPIMPPWRKRYAPNTKENLEHVFTLKLPYAFPIQLNPKEHQNFCWCSYREAAYLASSYTNRQAILSLFEDA